ncbi:glycosyltransferase [Conexibacter sp. DBS9H8]|uniref:glycosyltransferase n=1 Tax=Conexibacter sp. DBS9H8 TaxID=2937801 RepID=UPI00200C0EB8|nr:glycosyltransferase [Conexibacter sp. DBS9H8]
MISATVAIPTRGRASYLEETLAAIVPQAAAAGAEVVVVLDGPDPASAAVADAHAVGVLELERSAGANAARNLAVETAERAGAELIVFVDDDVRPPPGWLEALLAAAVDHPEAGVLGGPIRPVLEPSPRHCGAEPAPITSLDRGPVDREVDCVWGANMAVRLAALAVAGPFDEQIHGRGEEEEWQERHRAAGGRVRYVAAAGLEHLRQGEDARLGALARAQYRLGGSARANDVRKGTAPTLATELRDLIGAGWHLLARRCSFGAVFIAHALGRIEETLVPTPPPPRPGEFTSGHSGFVAGARAVTLARTADALADLRSAPRRRRLRRDAALWGRPLRVTVLSLEREDAPNILDAALDELARSRHRLSVHRRGAGSGGRFENLNALLTEAGLTAPGTDDPGGPAPATDDPGASAPAPALGGPTAPDWLLVIDDDVALPAGFLNAFLFLAERHRLTLAQPAHRRLSHAAWPVTRRRVTSAVRETAFVEIGPLVAFAAAALPALLPFPPLRYGWGVEAYWGALARAHGWRSGVVDATPITHALRPVGASYDQSAARAESRAFLAEHPHITVTEAARTLRTHTDW